MICSAECIEPALTDVSFGRGCKWCVDGFSLLSWTRPHTHVEGRLLCCLWHIALCWWLAPWSLQYVTKPASQEPTRLQDPFILLGRTYYPTLLYRVIESGNRLRLRLSHGPMHVISYHVLYCLVLSYPFSFSYSHPHLHTPSSPRPGRWGFYFWLLFAVDYATVLYIVEPHRGFTSRQSISCWIESILFSAGSAVLCHPTLQTSDHANKPPFLVLLPDQLYLDPPSP